MRNFDEIAREHLPPTIPKDPTLDIIAHSDPYELERAMGHISYKQQLTSDRLTEVESNIEGFWEDAAKRGEWHRSIYVKTLKHYQDTSDLYKAKYGEELTYLKSDLEHVKSMSMTPPEILGLDQVNDFMLQRYGEEQDSLTETAKANEGETKFAALTMKRRNQLGRPAKVMTWIASTALLAGLSIGISKIDMTDEKKDQDTSAVAEVVEKAGYITVLNGITLVPVYIAGQAANRHSAKRRAQRKLNKKR